MAGTSPGADRTPSLDPREGSGTALWTGVFALALVVIIGVLLIVFGGSSGPGSKHGGPGAAATKAPVAPLDEEGAWNPYLTISGGGVGASAAARALWEPVAEQFAAGFLGASRDARWQTRIKPLVTAELFQRLGRVDRRLVPTGKVTGLSLRASGDHVADVTVRYTSGRTERALGVELVDLPGGDAGWLVYGYEDRAGD